MVESIPVHEDIKLGKSTRDRYIEAYKENVRRVAKHGVKCVCYNFMPVFDWTRTHLDKRAADGSASLVMYMDQLRGLDPLRDGLSLPGWDSSYEREALKDSSANSLTLCTGSNDVVRLVRKYAGMNRIGFMHIRNVKLLPDGSFEETAHLSCCGSLDMYEIVRALTDAGFNGYVRPGHGRMIWGESGKPGYGLYDRALGAAYINGLFEACEKSGKGVR